MISKNNVVHIGAAKATLSEVPAPPSYLSNGAKRHYKEMGKKLIKLDRLKEVYLNALEIYAEAMAQFEFAAKEIKLKNKETFGEGYIQTYRSGASNISTEVVLLRDAEKSLFKCFKQFGLDPKSEKDLKATVDPAQGDLFEQFMNKKTS